MATYRVFERKPLRSGVDIVVRVEPDDWYRTNSQQVIA